MDIKVNSEGDKEISYKINEENTLLEEPFKCVMCNNIAFFMAKETEEPLCQSCYDINLLIREDKRL